MEVVNYLPGDQRLVDKIVYELKSQGIFDQFRKECFADVDTKPAYQNLRQRVEGNVTGFLKDQSWRPDMNKNQVREMLRKKISESGYLETGVERIVDQVVNPKINTIFLPKVEEVVYKFLGIQKPNNEQRSDEADLLPTDLEAVSPESKDNNSAEALPELDESKIDEDESPPFEPLDEQTSYLPHEENSVDSHISGFSAGHESIHSNENKLTQIEHDSQMSRNSSDSRLSIVTSDENSKIDMICDDSQSKSGKSNDSKSDDKSTRQSKEPEKARSSRSESSRDRDRDRRGKESRSRYSSSSKDAKDRKSSSSSSKSRSKSSSSKYASSSRDRSKSESSSSYRDKSRSSSSSHRDKSKSKSSDKYKHSSSTSSSAHDRHRKDASSSSSSRKKDSKQSKDDHYSSKEKKNDRRSTDRDSNDGNSGKNNSSSAQSDITSQNQKTTTESNQNSGESTSAGNSDRSESTKTPVNVSEQVENSEVALSSSVLRISKPKFASNMKEAMKLMKIRKQLAKLEKKNQLGFATVDVKTDVIESSSISLEDVAGSGAGLVPAPLENTVISQDNWDEMEAKLQQEVGKFQDTECSSEEDSDVKFFEKVELKKNEFVCFVETYFTGSGRSNKVGGKRKLEETDVKNNNNNNNGKSVMAEKKRRISRKTNIDGNAVEKFPLPLSPAESDASKEEVVLQGAVALKQKRTSVNKASSQRYSSDDLYKPRPTFASSRRRGAKPIDEN